MVTIVMESALASIFFLISLASVVVGFPTNPLSISNLIAS